VEKIIEHVRSAAEAKDIDPDIVESTYRAMISGFIELEMRVHKDNS
jgi:isochorismate pyruvate lyase